MSKNKKAHRGKAGGRLRRLRRLRALQRDLLKIKEFLNSSVEETQKQLSPPPEAPAEAEPKTQRLSPSPLPCDPQESPMPQKSAMELVPPRRPTRPCPIATHARKPGTLAPRCPSV
ncbi:TANK-binding kinase 1-binding protein 1 [Solenopsis invicta]|uniref:TANK-binding kinase 1-binding protein 1 n=1 Tax=Solenopsis invicta TaxID=13686 RepID=UPI00193CB4CE|nr:TANK-binding kinase 1-binding protein 1 [Solenopsis invicta]XP_039302354.1 TANK-binding kinase 1-binding protein 1 [Solenopsis invicta]